MPPKAARGAARGRGRRRGKALAPPAEEQASIPQPSMQDDLASQFTIAPSSPIEPPLPKVTTPHNKFLEDADLSPNSSPANVPTETPAPTPIRPPALRPESSGSMSSARGRGGARGGRVKTTESRFKPKNVRRDKTELKQLAEKEQARLAGIAAEAAREEARALRGRGRLMRGRGDAMGRGAGLGRPAGAASGIFGVVPEALRKSGGQEWIILMLIICLEKKPEFLAPRASGASGASGSGPSGPSGLKTVKKEGGTSSRGDYISLGGTRSKDWYSEPQYPHEDLSAPRVDIEHINLISDDSEEDPIFSGSRPRPNGKGKSTNKGGLKPVRLHREEHKERVTLVNTEPSMKLQPESDDELPAIDELRSSRAPPKDKEFKGVYRDLAGELRVKAEPGVEVTFQGSLPPTTSSPESKRKIKDLTSSPEAKQKTKDLASAIDLDLDDDAVAKAKKVQKVQRFSKKKDKKPVIQTEEDRAEYERHLEDVAILANELGGLQGNLGEKPTDAEGDVAMDGAVAEETDKKEGRLYLFQFPPVLPELYNPVNGKSKTKTEIKAEKEKEKAERDNDIQMTGMSAKGKGKMKEKADPTGDPTVIKVEEESLGPDGKSKKEDEKKKREDVVHEEGWIGKLIVRESGRVELCWGGTNLLVGRGVDAEFLTTGVMVDMIEKGPPGGGAPEGKTLSMGQVMGKFVVTPDWEKMI